MEYWEGVKDGDAYNNRLDHVLHLLGRGMSYSVAREIPSLKMKHCNIYKLRLLIVFGLQLKKTKKNMIDH